ncbi:hypothetical protein AALP_AA5G153600 [Arabis alpina]|uniref:Uncharacterized protein n=1 Tax=Arabis alpina TaxID=50452 RepID=A0A087GX99_ARAAL|nr:hypothetical protein AALP_AA5G153600 [Arabis alpina]
MAIQFSLSLSRVQDVIGSVLELILVGPRDFYAFGSHGSASHVRFHHFHSLAEARTYLKEEKDCDICGVEIADGSSQVNEHPFKKNTVFLLGNEKFPCFDFGTVYAVKGIAVGIWGCKDCRKVKAGGVYTMKLRTSCCCLIC